MENISAVNDHRGRGRSPSWQENRGSLCYVANFPFRISCSHRVNHLDHLAQTNESYRAPDMRCYTGFPLLLLQHLSFACKHRIQLLLLQYREGTTLGTEATNDSDCFVLTFACNDDIGQGIPDRSWSSFDRCKDGTGKTMTGDYQAAHLLKLLRHVQSLRRMITSHYLQHPYKNTNSVVQFCSEF